MVRGTVAEIVRNRKMLKLIEIGYGMVSKLEVLEPSDVRTSCSLI